QRRVLLLAERGRVDRAGSERVDGDVVPRPVGREAARQVDDAGAGGAGVYEGRRAAAEHVHVHDVHDRAEALRQEVRPDAAQHVPGPVQVQVDDGAPSAVRDLRRAGRELPARVVDDEVDTTEARERGRHQRVDLLHLADVGRVRETYAARALDLAAGGRERLRMAPGDHHLRVEHREAPRDDTADAAPAARDEGRAAGEEAG